MRVKIFLGILLTLVLTGCSNITDLPATQQGKSLQGLDLSCNGCNVIFLDIDLLRADYVNIINPKHNATPNIDYFFQDAIIFEDASSPSGLTRVSNYAVMTARDGMFVQIMGLTEIHNETGGSAFDNIGSGKLAAKLPTIAEVLKSRGYNTININEDYYSQSGKSQALDRGFDEYQEIKSTNKDIRLIDPIQYTISVLKDKEINKNRFLTITRLDGMHRPYRYPANRQIINDSRVITTAAEHGFVSLQLNVGDRRPVTTARSDLSSSNTSAEYMSNEQITQALYEQQLRYIDEELGRLFSYLENSSLMNNTIIVLYANHGEGLLDNGIISHGVSYQSSVYVPVMIRHPNIHEPIRIKQPISIIDLVPTIYEMTNTTAPKDIDGISLIPLIKNGTYEREYIYGLDDTTKYIRKDDMKLLVHISGQKQLFNITSDPHETNDTAWEYTERVNSLYQVMINHQLEMTKAVIDKRSFYTE